MRMMPGSLFVVAVALLAPVDDVLAVPLPAAAVQVWDRYVRATEARIDAELKTSPFLVIDRLSPRERADATAMVQAGAVAVVNLADSPLRGPMPTTPGALLHHWYGAVLVANVSVDDVLRFVQRYDDHARYFEDVTASRLESRNGARFVAFLKLRRQKVITVHYNTVHDVLYSRLDDAHASSRSVARKIAELEDPGTSSEREKPPGTDRGFLWRLNSYWRFEAREGGVLVECESLSLSRAVPSGLGWLVNPFVRSVPRESLERTLLSIRGGVRRAMTE